MRGLKAGEVGCPSMSKVVGPVCQGDSQALEQIYRSYRGLVHRICLRMLRDPTEAEDAVQDVFLRVFSKIHTFRGAAAFSSWLYRLTTNVVLMRFRKNKHKFFSLQEPMDDEDVPGREMGAPDSHLNGLLVRIDLQEAIDLLPGGYKATLMLHDVHGYYHKEIAEIFGYSIGNSKSQLYKAHKRLRKLLCDGKGLPKNANVVSVRQPAQLLGHR